MVPMEYFQIHVGQPTYFSLFSAKSEPTAYFAIFTNDMRVVTDLSCVNVMGLSL